MHACVRACARACVRAVKHAVCPTCSFTFKSHYCTPADRPGSTNRAHPPSRLAGGRVMQRAHVAHRAWHTSSSMTGKVTSVQWFKRSQRGLFAGKQRLTGNTVSPSKQQYVHTRCARCPPWRAAPAAARTHSSAPLPVRAPRVHVAGTPRAVRACARQAGAAAELYARAGEVCAYPRCLCTPSSCPVLQCEARVAAQRAAQAPVQQHPGSLAHAERDHRRAAPDGPPGWRG